MFAWPFTLTRYCSQVICCRCWGVLRGGCVNDRVSVANRPTRYVCRRQGYYFIRVLQQFSFRVGILGEVSTVSGISFVFKKVVYSDGLGGNNVYTIIMQYTCTLYHSDTQFSTNIVAHGIHPIQQQIV
jgi:hypothetical protein